MNERTRTTPIVFALMQVNPLYTVDNIIHDMPHYNIATIKGAYEFWHECTDKTYRSKTICDLPKDRIVATARLIARDVIKNFDSTVETCNTLISMGFAHGTARSEAALAHQWFHSEEE